MKPAEYRRRMHQRSRAERLKRLGGAPSLIRALAGDRPFRHSRSVEPGTGAFVHTFTIDEIEPR